MGPRIRVLPFPLLLSPYATDQPRPRLRAILRDGCYFRTRNVSSCFATLGEPRSNDAGVRTRRSTFDNDPSCAEKQSAVFLRFSKSRSHLQGRFCANFDLLWYLARPGNLADYARNAVGNDLKNVCRKSIFENHVFPSRK